MGDDDPVPHSVAPPRMSTSLTDCSNITDGMTVFSHIFPPTLWRPCGPVGGPAHLAFGRIARLPVWRNLRDYNVRGAQTSAKAEPQPLYYTPLLY